MFWVLDPPKSLWKCYCHGSRVERLDFARGAGIHLESHTWEAETGELGIRGHPQLQIKFRVSLCYRRPCLKNRSRTGEMA